MAFKNLDKAVGAAARHTNLSDRLWLVPMTDIDIDKFPVANKATITTVPLKSGVKLHYIDCRGASISTSVAPGETPLVEVLTVSAVLDGITPENLAFVREHAGEDMCVVWRRCVDGQLFLGGTPCSGGLQMRVSSIGRQDSGEAGIALEFAGKECPESYFFLDMDATAFAALVDAEGE